ncbi:MAG: DUF2225 domain-containing protein [Cellulosilyticaceae bacterium]
MDVTAHPLADILYDKTYECPLCNCHFSNKSIRLRKNQVISIDSDLYAHYSMVNPLLYDAIICPECGYGSLSSVFDKITATQKVWIREIICQHYKKRNWPEYLTPYEAIVKHQFALASAIAKRSKLGEQAYICLHIGWLYRDLGNARHEMHYLSKAISGFKKALETENFPVINLDEATTMYIISDISFRLGDYDSCRMYLAQVLTNRSSMQLKNRALDLKEKLRALS